mgnify:CR=1 FL=1
MRFELRRAGLLRQQWHIVLVGDNNEDIMWSEKYADKRSAIHAVELCRRTGPLTRLIDKDSGSVIG